MKVWNGWQKGANLGGWISQCVSYEQEHFDTFITEEDIRRLAGWGLDHVRLPLDYDIIMREDKTFIEKGFSYIDNCIAWCGKYGLHLILDLHKTMGYMFDAKAVPDADLFFRDTDLQDCFITIWKELALRYGKYSDMVALELLNEVTDPSYADVWNTIADRAIREIRKIAPDSYIVVGGVCNNSVTSVEKLAKPYDNKIIYNFHCYEPLIFTHQNAYWVDGMPKGFSMHYPAEIEEIRKKSEILPSYFSEAVHSENISQSGPAFFEALFQSAIHAAEKYDVPLYCGEYGVIDQAAPEDTLRWFQDIHQVFVKYGIGRSIWNYKNKDFGLVDEHYAGIRQELIQYL